MSDISMPAFLEMGANLASLAVKGTVSAVYHKINAIKAEKDIAIMRSKYDEIVNELLSEREEAIRIAQAYKHELDRYEISDEDIGHLHNTVGKALEILRKMSPTAPIEDFTQIKELISTDTLKTMQLLGFNFKAAIGEPLTQLCAGAILSIRKPQQQAPGKRQDSHKAGK